MATSPRSTPSPGPTAHALAPTPFTAPVSGDINMRMALIANAINSKADAHTPTFTWIKLTSPNGTTYAVSVDDGGNLHTTQVLRS